MQSKLLMLCYLISSISFIIGLKMLSHPETARKGNLIAGFGMSLAIIFTIFLYEDNGARLRNYAWIFGGLFIGGIMGLVAAKKVKMTAMPEMVSLFNGMGGACAALVSIIEFNHISAHFITSTAEIGELRLKLIIIFAGMIIGSISFSGSVIAWGKLNGKIKDLSFKGQHLINMIVLLIILALAVVIIVTLMPQSYLLLIIVFILALIFGILFVLPIGGADMPVVISLLNSFTGVAAACGGLLYNNQVMLTGGILVGAAGSLLTVLMCKAMNRSLKNVLIGSFGGNSNLHISNSKGGAYKEISLADAAMAMNYARKVIIVPGYGLAVAQAQHVCHELESLLEEKGVQVQYAIHPVAGRMPGHMNVLLAEADVDYEKLLEMEQANEELKTTDVALILGANDVVNPAAKTDPASPIYGMPILEVEEAKLVIVNKRTMKPGYAGIDNELFTQPKTSMLFGDAKSVLQKLVTEIKAL